MKRVITYGTFDLLHYGHINLLRRSKALGDYLIVALSTDEFNWKSKHKKTYFSYEERKQLLEAIRYVDLVIPEKDKDFVIETIMLSARSGEKGQFGDGKIFVTNLEQVIRIRTGETGADAV